MIGQAMDFYLAGDSSPAIHSKTTAKVRKRIGICKKTGKFLANPNKNSIKNHFKLFFSLHPNLVTAAAHRTYRRSSVGGDFLQLQGGGGAAQVVDIGII